jgi:hypothetical protein
MEPTNGELMTHLLYIRGTVDDLKAGQAETAKTVGEHTTEIAVIKANAPKLARWGAIGGLVGGFVSGILGRAAS